MKKFTKLAMLLPIAAVMLTACVATTAYRVGNTSYNNRDEAIAAAMRNNAEAEAAISAGAKPLVDRKLLIVTPTASAFSRAIEASAMKQGKQYPSSGTPARAQYDLDADFLVWNMQSVTSSVKKANIYREIEKIDVDTAAPDIQPSQLQDVLILYYMGGENGVTQMNYFNSARFGKQIVAVDWGKVNIGDRRKSLIDDIKAKALQ